MSANRAKLRYSLWVSPTIKFGAAFNINKIFALFVLLFVVSTESFAAALPEYTLTSDSPSLTEFDVAYYPDETNSQSFKTIKQLLSKDAITPSRFSLTDTESTHWFAFTLTNATEEPLDKVIRFGEAFLHRADLIYELNGDVVEIQNGLTVPIAQRDTTHRFPVFEITLAPNESRDFYLRVESRFVNYIGIFVSDFHEFAHENARSIAGYYLFFGGSLSLLAFNFFLFISLRDRSYLVYVCYGSLYVFFSSIYGGFSLFVFKTAELHYAIHCSISLVFVFMAQFVRQLLETKTTYKQADSLLKLVMVSFSVLSVLIVIDIKYYELFLTAAILAALAFWILGFFMIRRGSIIARFYLLATTLYLVAICISATMALGFLPYSTFARHAYMVGSISEMIILALALGYRYRLINIDKLEAERKLTLYEKQQRSMLESIVDERTAQLKKANKQLEKMSFTDGLTGIPNRRYFDETLNKEWHRMLRLKSSLTLIMCDIDYFKSFNDSFGHQAGDRCLQDIAKTIENTIKRSSDTAARFGGEEFAIILPNTNQTEALELCEIIQKEIQALNIQTPNSIETELLTLSFGVSSISPNAKLDRGLLVSQADEALYQSKQKGRNCASVFIEREAS